MIEINLEEIPSKPGVYLFKGEKGEVLYVGKAKDLRKRLSFYKTRGLLSPKIYHLLERASSLEWFLTENEKEALLLEANLIKKYRPKYNVVLKDDKNYPLLKIDLKERYPALKIVRRRSKGDKAFYFGPFTSSRALRETLKLISSLFPLRKCSLSEMQRRKTPCVYYQIKKCLAPCVFNVPQEEYKKLVQGVIEFFQGGGRKLIEKLEKEMLECAERLEFERAAFLRDRIRDLKVLLEKQSVVLKSQIDLDFWNFKKEKDKWIFIVLFVRYGYLYGYQFFEVKNPVEERVPVEEVLFQFYSEGKVVPEYIVVKDGGKLDFLERVLYEVTGEKTRIVLLKEDLSQVQDAFSLEKEELELLFSLSEKNLENYVFRRGEEKWSSQFVEEVMGVLRLKREPRRIEAIDLSQFYGDARIGAIVCFFEGEPLKSEYRKYNIKEAQKDDYSMLYEVVLRRFRRGIEEDNLPDLFLVDGGKGHLNVVVEVIKDLGLEERVEVRAVAKDEKRRPVKLYIPGRKNYFNLSRHTRIYRFIGEIMLEAHRFAKSFATSKKTKEEFESFLEKLPGIGPKRREILLKRFKNLEDIAKASLEELAALPSFNFKVAKALKEYLGKNQF